MFVEERGQVRPANDAERQSRRAELLAETQ
jgi:hypothetical protein